jgi:hypothetical protein
MTDPPVSQGTWRLRVVAAGGRRTANADAATTEVAVTTGTINT